VATVGEIQTIIEENTGRDDKSAVIQQRILDAILEIQRRDNHYFMEVSEKFEDLIVDQQIYPFSASDLTNTYRDITNIYLLDSDGTWTKDSPLELLSLEEAKYFWNADDEGDPEAYSFVFNSVHVWPPKPQDATQDLFFDGYTFLPVLSFPAGTNELTEQFPDLVEAWATWKFYAKLPHANEEADFWQRIAKPLYEDLVTYSISRRLRGKTVIKIRTTPRQVSGRRRGTRPFGGR